MTFFHEFSQPRLGSPWLCCALLLMGAAPALAQSGDAEYGKEMLEVRRCTVCHPVAGEGGGTAPDLGRRSSEEYSPAKLAAEMWTHAPVMWKGMEERNMPASSRPWNRTLSVWSAAAAKMAIPAGSC